jgi:hypothetical protein
MTLDLRTITANEAITAVMTVEGLRVRAGSLHTGDRIVYHRNGVYCLDTVASVTGSWYPGVQRLHDVTITTESGDAWSCSHENRSTLRIAAGAESIHWLPRVCTAVLTSVQTITPESCAVELAPWI